MLFLDFFAGIGGFRSGLERAGHKCVGFCEWDKYARQSYKAMYNTEGEWENHDVRSVRVMELPRADIWCFGFPCQDISVAGKQKGLENGERSGLFFEIMRLLDGLKEEDRPEWLIAENVKNLLSIGNGFDFLRCLTEMGGRGYDVEWQLFNTKYSYIAGQTYIAGIPQNRERVYLVCHLRARGQRKILPIPRADEEDNSELRQVGELQSHRKNPDRGRVYDSEGVSPTLNCMSGGGRQPAIVDDTNMGFDHGGLRIHEDCPTLRSERSGLKVAVPVLTPDREEKRQNGRRFKEDGEEMFTLTAQDRHGVMVRNATKQGYDVAYAGDSVDLAYPESDKRRARVGKGETHALTCSGNMGVAVYDAYNKTIAKRTESGTVQAHHGQQLFHVVENVYDSYNHKMRKDGACGTLTTNAGGGEPVRSDVGDRE